MRIPSGAGAGQPDLLGDLALPRERPSTSLDGKNRRCPPSSIGTGRRLRIARLTLIRATKNAYDTSPCCACCPATMLSGAVHRCSRRIVPVASQMVDTTVAVTSQVRATSGGGGQRVRPLEGLGRRRGDTDAPDLGLGAERPARLHPRGDPHVHPEPPVDPERQVSPAGSMPPASSSHVSIGWLLSETTRSRG